MGDGPGRRSENEARKQEISTSGPIVKNLPRLGRLLLDGGQRLDDVGVGLPEQRISGVQLLRLERILPCPSDGRDHIGRHNS